MTFLSYSLHCFKFQAEAKEFDKEKHELYRQIEKLEEEENVLKKQQIDTMNELEKYENVIKENQQRIKHWKKEVKLFVILSYSKNICS